MINLIISGQFAQKMFCTIQQTIGQKGAGIALGTSGQVSKRTMAPIDFPRDARTRSSIRVHATPIPSEAALPTTVRADLLITTASLTGSDNRPARYGFTKGVILDIQISTDISSAVTFIKQALGFCDDFPASARCHHADRDVF